MKTTVPEWAKDRVWYQIFPERFRSGFSHPDRYYTYLTEKYPGWQKTGFGTDWYKRAQWEIDTGDPFWYTVKDRRYGGDLKGIYESIPYLKKLGINAIYLNPVFYSSSAHKYDHNSLHHIDPFFGPKPLEDIEIIQSEIKPHNPQNWVYTNADRYFFKLIAELHRNGIRIILDGVFNHSGREFFAFQDILKNGKNSEYCDWYDIKDHRGDLDYSCWLGHRSLPEFARDKDNLSIPVLTYIENIIRRFTDPDCGFEGVDGWRLDAVDCLPMGFIRHIQKYIKSCNGDALTVGELWHLSPEYVGDGFDSLMNYPFAYMNVEHFVDSAGTEKYIESFNNYISSYNKDNIKVMQNLYSSHDTSRMTNIVMNPNITYRDPSHFQRTQIFCNPSYKIDSLSPLLKNKRKSMIAMQFMFPGCPMIYYGDAIGMNGANDPDCRKPMVWADVDKEPEKRHPLFAYRRPENLPDRELFDFYRKMIRIYKENSEILKGDSELIILQKDIIMLKRHNDRHTIFALFNRSKHYHKVLMAEKGLYDLFAKRQIKGKTVRVNPSDFRILKNM